jgi:hypothetical protein
MLQNPMHSADPPESEHFNEKYERTVDLKWSVWSRDKTVWDERAPGVWEWMREWFEASTDDGNPESAGLSGLPRKVSTAPRKEIRFGDVEISPGQAQVHFWAEWDSGRIFSVEAVIETETFEELMHQIDHLEVDLMRDQCAAEHIRKGWRLQELRCDECGYPYRDPKSRRLRQ